jgi:hypothetical protein
VLRAPRRVDLVGLRWARGERLEAQVRARRAGGAWTPWMPLPPAGDHAPDGRAAPSGTQPAWTGPADLLQLRLRGRARGLEARFVRARPTATLARRASARLAARAREASAPPRIISRAEWGAAAVPPRAAPAYGQVQLAFIHHTVTRNDYAPEDSAAIVLGIARFHVDGNEWNDIGYNFLVDRFGQVFEGRAGGVDQAVIGAQSQGYNSVSTGIGCLGDFTAISQSPQAMDALARLVGWKLSLHAVPVQGPVTVVSLGGESNAYPAGTLVTFQRISGRRDGDRTACPGDALYAQLDDLRRRALAYAGPPASTLGLSIPAKVRGVVALPASGVLRLADGSSPEGLAVTVEHRATGSAAWVALGGAPCAADGRWATSLAVPRSGTVRAVYPGDGAHPRVESPLVSLTVLPRLTIRLSARRVRAGRALRVSGTLSPAAGRVAVLLERKVGRRYVRVQRKQIRVGRAGRYATLVRPRRSGVHRVTIAAPGAVARRLVVVRR